MNEPTKQAQFCTNCENEVAETDEFCPSCGNLFEGEVFCNAHSRRAAEGVCIICATPFCGKCGSWANGLFLCAEHEDYEVYEGMARIYGTSNETLAQYARRCLEQAGLHPFLYSRKASPISIGGPSYTLFRASGEYDGHIINEMKVLVPCQEVTEAEQVLKDLDILK